MTIVRKLMVTIGAMLLLSVVSPMSFGAGWTYEGLVDVYLGQDGAQQDASIGLIHSEKLEALNDERELWDYIWNTHDSQSRAEAGLKLLDMMVGGQPSRWNRTAGFLDGWSLPRSVVVFQTTLVTTVSLLEQDSDAKAWKARELAQGLLDSTETFQVIRRGDLASALKVASEMRTVGGRSWVAERGGTIWKLSGNPSLPFGIAPLERGTGRISHERTLSKRMVGLNNFGQVTSGQGTFAWDLPTGKIYRVHDQDQEKSSDVGARDSGGNDDSDGDTGGGDDDGDDGDDGDTGGGDDDGDDGDTGGGDDDGDNGDTGSGDDDNGGSTGGPGNGNGNSGNPGNGGGNTGGSGPGTGNGGGNNGQGGGSGNGGGGSGNGGANGNSGGNQGGGPGNGNGNSGNPGNGGGNTGGSGPGTGNGGGNNGQGGGSGNGGGGSGNGNRSGLGDGTNPGSGDGRDNSPNEGTENPGGN